MVVRSTFEIVNPTEGLSALNELLQAGQGGQATLTVRSIDEDDDTLFTLVVSEVRLEHDSTGMFLLDAVAALGAVTGRLWPTSSPGQVAGKLTITPETEGVFPS